MSAQNSSRRLPGDFAVAASLKAALRVDHAGEYGATRIYAGQRAVLKHHACADQLAHMAEQEAVHLDTFNRVLPQYGVRPTALMPLWHVGGWVMGAATAAIGVKAAMACTVAVETVIADHYQEQLNSGMLDDSLQRTISQFRDEEMEHHAIGLAQGAEHAPLYEPLSTAIRSICRAAIAICKRV